jgi:hypothetical protein
LRAFQNNINYEFERKADLHQNGRNLFFFLENIPSKHGKWRKYGDEIKFRKMEKKLSFR